MTKKIAIAILGILFFCVGTTAYSEDITEESYDKQLSYSVFPVHPDTHQGEKDSLFFDLRLSEKEETTIYIKITNDGLRDEKFRININQATTTKNGNINYQGEPSGIHSSLKYNINDYVTYDNIVEVPAKNSVVHPIKVKCPEDLFDGIILAGIFVELDDNSDDSAAEGIVTTTGYSFALMISQNDHEVTSLIELDSVYPEASYETVNIVAKLFNPEMKGYGGLSYNAVVTRNNKEFINKQYKDKEFAPNSFCEFSIEGDNKPLLAGDYVVNLSIEDKRGNHWHFEDTFKVTKKMAKEMNSIALIKTENHITIYIVCFIILVVIIIMLKKYTKKWRNKNE